jgi:nicotinamide phosphoribosyltransferase
MLKNLLLLKDFYKVGHVFQYPKGTELVFSNFTPRKSLMPGVNGSVFFGLKYFIEEYLTRSGDVGAYKEQITASLGVSISFEHIEELDRYIHKHHYLPLKIYAVDEGTFVPSGVPALVLFNLKPEFYWLPNMLETILSCTLWGPCTSATIAREYRSLFDKYCTETSDNNWFVDFQGHDFSFRGMYGLEAAALSGAAHLLYFKGTDTIPAITLQRDYYDKESSCGMSVPATEHSVMSAGGKEHEFGTYKRLITEVYPNGIVSIVSDTWNLWQVIDEYLPKLKQDIVNREGKVIIRPDSGDPVEVTIKTVQKLWDIFGGLINSKGYKELDSHIGVIYGDSITLERAKQILQRLKDLGFSSTNVVFGIGSYTYQYNTRDTLGWAMKATYCEINGKGYPITKDPITDNGTKKSHSGILKVIKNKSGELEVQQNCSWDQFYADDNQLKRAY